jgi:hypothetical protein
LIIKVQTVYDTCMPTKYIFLLLGILFTSWFALITPADRFADPDAFYHITIAKLIHEQGPITEFPWLDLTTLGTNYADQHFLFHVLQIPFLLFLDPLRASQVSSIFFAVFCMLGISFIFYKLKLNHWWLWPILLIFTQPFTTRLIQGKASPLAILLWFTAIATVLYILRRDKPQLNNHSCHFESDVPSSRAQAEGRNLHCDNQLELTKGDSSHALEMTKKVYRLCGFPIKSGMTVCYFVIGISSFLFTLTHGGWLLLPISIILILLTNALHQHLLSKEAGRIRRNQSTISPVPQHLLSKSSLPSNDGEAGETFLNSLVNCTMYDVRSTIVLIGSTLSASLLAILLHPNRNQLFSFLKVQIFDVAIATPQALRLGTEWNSGNIQSALSILGVFGIILLLTAIAHITSKNCVQDTKYQIPITKYQLPNTNYQILNTIILSPLLILLFLASLKSLRFAEYFQPLLALQTAILASTINWKQFFKNLHLPLTAKHEIRLPTEALAKEGNSKFELNHSYAKFEIRNSKFELFILFIILISLASITLQHSLSAYT